MTIGEKAPFTKLFEPGRIGTLEIKNRVVLPPMVRRLADGPPTQELIDHYEEIARGGTGLVTVESTYIDPVKMKMSFGDDSFIPRFKVLSDAIHKAGAKAAIQLTSHQGIEDEVNPLSPSDAPVTSRGVKPRVLTEEDIRLFVERYGKMAKRAK